MSSRELFQNVMHYGQYDRVPVWHWNGWPETKLRWENEGMPSDVDPCVFFSADPMPPGVPYDCFLTPLFDDTLLEETDSYRIFRQPDGVVAQHFKGRSALPHYVDFTLKGRDSWPEYQRRLQPDFARIPANTDDAIRYLISTGQPLSINTGSLAGWLRDWMGVENFCMTCCEDPDL